MAKVKDTESFIAAARAIHGNRYDYSQSVFTKSQEPITIICRVCGPVVLSEAASHYKKGRFCGCRTCEIKSALRKNGRFKVCPSCKKWSKYRDSYGYCRECKQQAKDKRKEARAKKKTRHCKFCKKAFVHHDSRKVFCSKECLLRRKELTRVETECCVCGKSIVKQRSLIRDNNCCGHECQKIWAGKCGSKLEPHEKSKRAKRRWQKLRQRERKKRLFAFVKSKLHEMEFRRKEAEADPWTNALRTRLNGNKHRRSVRPVVIKPSKTIEQALKKIGNRRKWFEKSDWEKKVNNRLSNQSARRNRKHVAKLARRSGDEKDRGIWFQVCFDWMANHT